MDTPPIPRLMDLVHAFNGIAVEQFKERFEKLFSDSILLWRLLKLLFKILYYAFQLFFGSISIWIVCSLEHSTHQKLYKKTCRTEPSFREGFNVRTKFYRGKQNYLLAVASLNSTSFPHNSSVTH